LFRERARSADLGADLVAKVAGGAVPERGDLCAAMCVAGAVDRCPILLEWALPVGWTESSCASAVCQGPSVGFILAQEWRFYGAAVRLIVDQAMACLVRVGGLGVLWRSSAMALLDGTAEGLACLAGTSGSGPGGREGTSLAQEADAWLGPVQGGA
jgi:hypothetical protein